MSTGTPDYAKWIRDALADNPRLNKSGLSRHLRHGQDRSRVSKMLSGQRRIRIDEVADIASYLGVPPPTLTVGPSSRTGPETTYMGTIATGVWHEGRAKPVNTRGIAVPARPDPRWPAEHQGCYEITGDIATLMIRAGDYVIAYHGGRYAVGDVVVVERARGELTQLGLARVLETEQRTSAPTKLEALTGNQPEIGRPVALVISVFRPIA